MKKNIFGTSSFTPGQNLVRALNNFVQEADYTVGILKHRYAEMVKVFNEALTIQEQEIICRGFGFGCEPQKQNVIAEELNLTPTEVSVMARKAVNKLKKSPYKVQLMGLVYTYDEVDTLVAQSLVESDASKQLDEYKYRLNAAQTAIERTEKEKAAAMDNLAKTEHLLRRANSELKKLEEENLEGQQQILKLEAEIERLKSGNDVARRRMRAVFDKIESVVFDGDPDDTTASAGMDSLELPSDVTQALSRAGITDLETLCNTSKHALIKLGVGQKNVDKIKEALKKKGLTLKK